MKEEKKKIDWKKRILWACFFGFLALVFQLMKN